MTLEGPLNKWTNHFHGWQYRYFVLDINNSLLSYYLVKENVQKGEIRGCIKLNEAFVGYDKDDDILFTITVGDKTFHLQASNLAEKEKWVSRIEKAIILSHFKPVSSSREETRITQEDILASAEKFDSIVTELDAYLQLLIEQNKNLEDRYQLLASSKTSETHTSENESEGSNSELSSDSSVPEEVREKQELNKIIQSSKTLIETVKHSIVCLQIAKVNCDPRNGLHTDNDLQQVLSFFNNNTRGTKIIKKALNSEYSDTGESSANSCTSSTQEKQSQQASATLAKKILDIPFNTFTTSDDDESKSSPAFHVKKNSDLIISNFGTVSDDNESFYDAVSSGDECDYTADIKIEAVHSEISTEVLVTEDFRKMCVENPTNGDCSDDDDEEFEDEDLDINNQSSVITHLLTQVRIGMDLTKITLPTFILETRSLLEMYADFFAVTELFLKIPDIACPHERMIQVVRWYMSTFRAGRKSPVAKKPYNPVLGEIFQCWYNLPGGKATKSSSDSGDRPVEQLSQDGPVPWANDDQLTFIAEQVSHHPPISAFYAEHVNKRVQLEGYTWTKSSFLGLSIAVHMVGKAVVSLIDLDEEYVMTFPSAYGRSILGVPWFEMGGTVQIDCAKTGYQATIQFLTKPFYGGKKHQISGSICGADRKVLNTIEGDWNGTMFLKTGKKIEILINTQSMPQIRKQTRKLKEQCETESRRIWKDVTYSLRTKQIEDATLSKQRIEAKQREGVKLRKEQGVKWENKYFLEQAENSWVYKNPLKERLKNNNTIKDIVT